MADNKTMKIVVDDGSQRVSIENTSGEEIGVFSFRPTDIAIVQRYTDAMAKFDEIVAPLENVNVASDGTAETEDDKALEAIKEAEKRLYEACDYVFGGNMSEAFFGKMHPFSPIDGVFYCETALNKLGEFISAQFEQETTKINNRLKKYVAGYVKKK